MDVLRSTAIICVVTCHGMNFFIGYQGSDIVMRALGYFGVELFFVLSGFLVGGLLLEDFVRDPSVKSWIGRFWMRRWLRTLPNYYLFLAIAVVLEYAWNGDSPPFGLFVFLLQNFAWEQSRLFGQSWSLTIEELFYLTLPLLLLASASTKASAKARFVACCAILFLFSFALRIWGALGDADFSTGVRQIAIFRLDALMVGVLAYYLYRKGIFAGNSIVGAVGAGLCAVSILTVFGVFGDYAHSLFWRIFWFPITSFGCAALLIGFLRPNLIPKFLHAPAANIARWSYSMYLVNSPLVISMLTWLPYPGEGQDWLRYALFAAYFTVTILLARLVYVYFEAPIIRSRDLVGGWFARPIRPAAEASETAR